MSSHTSTYVVRHFWIYLLKYVCIYLNLNKKSDIFSVLNFKDKYFDNIDVNFSYRLNKFWIKSFYGIPYKMLKFKFCGVGEGKSYFHSISP